MSDNVNQIAPAGDRVITASGEVVHTVDEESRSYSMITDDHRAVHDERMFAATFRFQLATTAVKEIMVQAPATGHLHFKVGEVTSTADNLYADLYEACSTASATGISTVSMVNKHRDSTATSTLAFRDCGTAVATANGTLLEYMTLPGGTGVGSTRSGSMGNLSNEWVLKPSTWYMKRFQNNSSSSATITMNVAGYMGD